MRYWYGAWQRGVRRQAVWSKNSGSGHYQRRRMAIGRCPPGGDSAVRILLALGA